jgi:DNA-binding SARP family transcriptional activator
LIAYHSVNRLLLLELFFCTVAKNYLRKIIKPCDVKLSNQRYGLTGSIWYDAAELKTQVKNASQNPDFNASELLGALEFYKRDYLDQIHSYWTLVKRQEMEQLYLQGLSLLGNTYIKQKQFRQAILIWRRYLLKDEYHEEAYRALMVCYTALGNITEARQIYSRCQQAHNEMSTTPSREIQALYEQLA